MLGLPFGNDQRSNLAKGKDEGYALKLDWAELSEELLYKTITELINEPKYYTSYTLFQLNNSNMFSFINF